MKPHLIRHRGQWVVAVGWGSLLWQMGIAQRWADARNGQA